MFNVILSKTIKPIIINSIILISYNSKNYPAYKSDKSGNIKNFTYCFQRVCLFVVCVCCCCFHSVCISLFYLFVCNYSAKIQPFFKPPNKIALFFINMLIYNDSK